MADVESAVDGPEEEVVINPLELFPDHITKEVEGLIYIGELRNNDVRYCGHTFGLQTLKPQHKYAIGQVLQQYRGTIYEVDILQNATVATALTHVDNKRDFCDPMGPSLEAFVQGRLNYVSDPKNGWYGQTLEFLWTQYQMLEATATIAIQELHRLSAGSEPTISSPWLDSLKEQARSQGQTNLAFQPSMTSS